MDHVPIRLWSSILSTFPTDKEKIMGRFHARDLLNNDAILSATLNGRDCKLYQEARDNAYREHLIERKLIMQEELYNKAMLRVYYKIVERQDRYDELIRSFKLGGCRHISYIERPKDFCMEWRDVFGSLEDNGLL